MVTDLQNCIHPTERERDIILDAFALLGGNENLVSQILDRLQETSFR